MSQDPSCKSTQTQCKEIILEIPLDPALSLVLLYFQVSVQADRRQKQVGDGRNWFIDPDTEKLDRGLYVFQKHRQM